MMQADLLISLQKMRDELIETNTMLKEEIATIKAEISRLKSKIIKQNNLNGCEICQGDLRWPDGKVHAKVCFTCFKNLQNRS